MEGKKNGNRGIDFFNFLKVCKLGKFICNEVRRADIVFEHDISSRKMKEGFTKANERS